jgi:hypothetical protein
MSSDITVPGNSIDENMKVVITNDDTLSNIANQNLNTLAQVPGFNINSNDGILVGINKVMEQTALKVGCCMRAKDDNTGKIVQVRTPLQSSTTKPMLQKFGFQWGTLNIPGGSCPANLYKTSPDCDTFFDIYSSNLSTAFLNKVGPNFGNDEFAEYAPECACYAPRTLGQQQYPPGIPPKCYKSHCSVDGGSSYPDPVSRGEPCSTTICSSVINTAGLSAGGIANITPTVTQQCGYSSKTESENASGGNKAFGAGTSTGLSIILNPSFLACCIICSCLISIIYYSTRKSVQRI